MDGYIETCTHKYTYYIRACMHDAQPRGKLCMTTGQATAAPITRVLLARKSLLRYVYIYMYTTCMCGHYLVRCNLVHTQSHYIYQPLQGWLAIRDTWLLLPSFIRMIPPQHDDIRGKHRALFTHMLTIVLFHALQHQDRRCKLRSQAPRPIVWRNSWPAARSQYTNSVSRSFYTYIYTYIYMFKCFKYVCK
jgi:hypothetical protein